MDYRDEYDRGRRYRGEGYYGGSYDSPKRDREHREWERGGAQRRESDRRRGDDRGFFERAGDEVRSWFGDEDAERRRMRDERDERRGWGEPARGWTAREDDDVDRDWARQWGYVEGRGRGSAQQPWQYRDRGYREPQSSSPSQPYVGSSWTRESGYGREGWGDPSGWGPETGWQRSSGDARQGPHAGRGPRGYTRSDERIREDICDRLAEHGFVDALCAVGEERIEPLGNLARTLVHAHVEEHAQAVDLDQMTRAGDGPVGAAELDPHRSEKATAPRGAPQPAHFHGPQR